LCGTAVVSVFDVGGDAVSASGATPGIRAVVAAGEPVTATGVVHAFVSVVEPHAGVCVNEKVVGDGIVHTQYVVLATATPRPPMPPVLEN
jgi:hypothetical protein